MTDLFSDDDFDIPDAAEDEDDGFDLDSLRVSSARAGSMYDENMEDYEAVIDDPAAASSSGFSLANFSSGQKLVLSILLVLDIIAVGVGVAVVTGIIG